MDKKRRNENRLTVDKFADIEILRYQVPGFEELSLKEKQLIYHLSEAALMGRDILFDQNCRYNLAIRNILEEIYTCYKGNKEDKEYKALEIYLKRIWFSNGIHHHYAEDKFAPGFSKEFFIKCLKGSRYDKQDIISEILPVIFDREVLHKRTVQSGKGDLITSSANNYYGEDITQQEVETYYSSKKKNAPVPDKCVSFGLNSQLVKENGQLVEKVWKTDGMYGPAIKAIVNELEKALEFAENKKQKDIISTLIEYYHSGNLEKFDEYSIKWLQDTDSRIDFINGFIETYGDPLGLKASWEAVVNFKNLEATKRTETISRNAQWFEDHSPVDPRFKKERVKGVTAKVITVAMLGGDCYPSTPIGINLPNADWIRSEYGSKSVTIENITEAYDEAAQNNGFTDEFVWSDSEKELLRKYGFITDNLHTDLHECLGHGSGKLLPGTDPDALKAYSSTIEEARADLFGLYYIADPQMVALGLLPDMEAYKAGYYRYMMNGLLTQLVRIEAGKNVEEAHMRNRQLIARWVYEKGADRKVVELKGKNGKTYVTVNDYPALRTLFGRLLSEIQRIKSEGDYEAGRNLVETYGVKVDPNLHKEMLYRYSALELSPYKGFVNPVLEEVRNKEGKVTDIRISYTEGYQEQMLRYSKDYSFLEPLL